MAGITRYSLDKIEGLLLGLFIGDAIGSRFDGRLPDEIPPLDSQYVSCNPPRAYTDDTQMAISLFEEMAKNGLVDRQSLVCRFLARYAPWRGYGGGMARVIERWRDGCGLEDAARSLYGSEGSYGDGAAVRASVIGAFFSLDQLDEMSEQVRLSSLLTHTHPYGVAGAMLHAYVVMLALNDLPMSHWLPRLYAFPTENVFTIKLDTIQRCLERESSPHESAQEIGNGSDALTAIPAALFSVMRNPLSFSDAVLFAVSLGGDADTIGAMTGAIAGARFGLRGIPPEWLESLENGIDGRDALRELARRSQAGKGVQ